MFPPSKYCPKSLTLALPGVHLQLFLVNYAQKNFLRPGGARKPSPPSWLRLWPIMHPYTEFQRSRTIHGGVIAI